MVCRGLTFPLSPINFPYSFPEDEDTTRRRLSLSRKMKRMTEAGSMFHLYFTLGMVAFFLFWTILLARYNDDSEETGSRSTLRIITTSNACPYH